MPRWAEIIAHYLEPGGTFYIAEAHPSCRIFPTAADITDGSTDLRPMFPYFHDPAGTRWEPSTDYADETARHTVAEHSWQHSMGDIVNALVTAGLRIDFLHEFSHCTWKVVAFAERSQDGSWRLPVRFPTLPLMFSLRATRPPTEQRGRARY